MNNIATIITEELSKPRTKNTVQATVSRILGEDIGSGDSVAVIDDPTWGQAGAKGKCKGPSAKGSGFVDVELANGTTVAMQSSLLLKL